MFRTNGDYPTEDIRLEVEVMPYTKDVVIRLSQDNKRFNRADSAIVTVWLAEETKHKLIAYLRKGKE